MAVNNGVCLVVVAEKRVTKYVIGLAARCSTGHVNETYARWKRESSPANSFFMNTVEDYEKKIMHIFALWKKCDNEQSKRILVMQGKLLRTAQNRCREAMKSRPIEPENSQEKPLGPDELYNVAKMIFG